MHTNLSENKLNKYYKVYMKMQEIKYKYKCFNKHPNFNGSATNEKKQKEK